jgi:hypothetical protein
MPALNMDQRFASRILWDQLAHVPAKFNPFRELKERDEKGMLLSQNGL